MYASERMPLRGEPAKASSLWLALASLCAAAVLLPFHAAVALDAALVVIVHPASPVKQLSENELFDLFTTERTVWPDGERVLSLNLPPHSETRATFDLAVLRQDPDGVGRFWIDRRVRGGAPPPRSVPSAQLVVRLVEAAPGAIGYVPIQAVAGSKVRIVAKIIGNKVVAP